MTGGQAESERVAGMRVRARAIRAAGGLDAAVASRFQMSAGRPLRYKPPPIVLSTCATFLRCVVLETVPQAIFDYTCRTNAVLAHVGFEIPNEKLALALLVLAAGTAGASAADAV